VKQLANAHTHTHTHTHSMTIVGKKLEPKQIEDNEDQLIFYPIITIEGNNNVDPKAESINQQTVNLRYEYFVVVTTQRTHTHTHTHTHVPQYRSKYRQNQPANHVNKRKCQVTDIEQ